MATGPIKIDIDSARAEAKLAEFESPQLSAAFAAVGRMLLNRIRLCFRTGTSPYGNTWAPVKFRALRLTGRGKISPTGRKQQAANNKGGGAVGQPLRDTGRMARSFTSQPDAKGVTVGTNIKAESGASIARVHQFGATITPKNGKFLVFPGPNGNLIFAKRVKIPARPFMPITHSGVIVLPPSWLASARATILAAIVGKKKTGPA